MYLLLATFTTSALAN